MTILGCWGRYSGCLRGFFSARWCREIGFLVGFFLFWFTVAFPLPGDWKTYTSKKEVRDVAVTNGVVWAATSGGLFSMTLPDTVFQEFTTSEGLRINDLSTLTVDQSGSIWIGASNGLIHAYKPSSRQWKYITEIARSGATQKKITALLMVGDTLYIGSEIGLNSYLVLRDQIEIDTKEFGNAARIRGNVTSVALHNDSIWVGTLNGIAVASRSHSNLRDPGAWRVWQVGLPSTRVSSLATRGNVLYAATMNGLARYSGSSWMSVPATVGRDILRIVARNDLLYCTTASELFTVDSAGNIMAVVTIPSLSSIALDDSQIVLGSSAEGVYVQIDGTWQPLRPKGLPTNRIAGLAVDGNSVLWAGTGSASGEGFLSFDGKVWTQYALRDYPLLGTNQFHKVNVGNDNVKWISSWGDGVAMVDGEGRIRTVYTTQNGLTRTGCSCRDCPDPRFVVIVAVITDPAGKVWFVSRPEHVDTVLSALGQDSSWTYVVKPPSSPGCLIFTDGVVDAFGTLWLANSKGTEGHSTGLYFYNERGFPSGGSARWGRLSTVDGLAGDQVFSVIADRSNQVWVGTDKGITIVVNPYSIRPQLAQYVPLRDQPISALAVDALNNKWVATNQGIFVLSSDGTSILAEYTVENTDGKLVANEIQSIAIDGKTGTVYFGSEKGLTTLSTSAVTPARSFDELSVSPNPFYVPASMTLTIDGLVQNTSLKILSTDGQLIKEVRTPGGRVGYWDGTDAKGNLVSSGVYIIVAYAANGSQVATAKVAVLRR